MQPDVLRRLLASTGSGKAIAWGLLMVVGSVPLVGNLYQDIQLAAAALVASDPDPTSSVADPAVVSVDALIRAGFFGAGTESPSAQQARQDRVPETRMGLQLHGLISSTVTAEARALIAQTGQRARYYSVNDELPGGASIHSIAADQVVLSRNGLLETLSFSKPQNSADTTSFAAADNDIGVPAADGPSSQFQQLHESQVASHAADESAYTESPEGEPAASSQASMSIPSPAPMSVKERLKQLRESRDL